MMKTLIIMRHAHAANSGFNDFERKLTPEGVSEARSWRTVETCRYRP